MADFLFKLYISGQAMLAQLDINKLQTTLKSRHYELVIVDVLENPDSARRDLVMATPMLLRVQPPPPLRLIGDFSDTAAVLSALES